MAEPSLDARAALERFSPATRAWFTGAFDAPTAAQAGAWDAVAEGRHALGRRPDGVGQDARGLPLGAGRAGRRSAARRTLAALPGPRRLAAEGPRRGCRAQPARPTRGHLAGGPAASGLPEPTVEVGMRTGDTPADERRRFATRPPDILITTPESLFLLLTSQARESLSGVADRDHRRGARRRGDQARRAPGPVAGAAGRTPRAARATHRPVRDRAPDRGDRPLPRRSGVGGGGGAAVVQDRRVVGRRARGGHARARRVLRASSRVPPRARSRARPSGRMWKNGSST